jgi:hypothetical protein
MPRFAFHALAAPPIRGHVLAAALALCFICSHRIISQMTAIAARIMPLPSVPPI